MHEDSPRLRSLDEPWRTAFDRRRRRYVERWEEAVTKAAPAAGARSTAVAVQSCLGLVFSLADWPRRLLSEADTPILVERFVEGGLALLTEGSVDR